MTDRDNLREHLKYYRDLGVAGLTTDPVWRERDGGDPNGRPDTNGGRDFSPGMDQPNLKVRPPLTAPDSETDLGSVTAGGRDVSPGMIMPTLEDIRADIGECTRCKLHTLGRQMIVFGSGHANADLMFVGEAPGSDEDEQGVPFVGRAGQLLTKIIEAIGLTRDDVYIANVIKCRPPGNRNPEPDEVATCEPFLFQQIDSIKPKVIVALGTFAAHTLLKTDVPISRIRGTLHDYRGAQLIPTFHPAYLLRSPERKREVWEDMKLVKSLLDQA